MKERPIIFSSPMVRAILDGRKTMTRRVMKHDVPFATSAYFDEETSRWYWDIKCGVADPCLGKCPYGQPGDRLWVREAWGGPILESKRGNLKERVLYRQGDSQWRDHKGNPARWHPPIFMPRRASRLLLERAEEARVERVEDITEEDARREGFNTRAEFLDFFYRLFPKMRGKNPWVWVISFRRLP